MTTLIKKLISIIGWKKLVSKIWQIAYAELKKLAKKSKNTDLDDKILEFINEILTALLQGQK